MLGSYWGAIGDHRWTTVRYEAQATTSSLSNAVVQDFEFQRCVLIAGHETSVLKTRTAQPLGLQGLRDVGSSGEFVCVASRKIEDQQGIKARPLYPLRTS